MATAEAAPSYAPEDPTLPKPWTGLIDGSTGVLYYWNPETNATQYEKPGALATTLLATTPAPNLSLIPMAHSQLPNNMYQQESGQQIHQHQQQSNSMYQRESDQLIHQHQQQPMYQMPNQQAQPMANQQAQQYSHMHMNQMIHPQFSQPKEQSLPYPQSQLHQGLRNDPQLGKQNGFSMGKDLRKQEGAQVGYTAPPIQRTIGASGDPHFSGPSPLPSQVTDYSVHPEQQSVGFSCSRQHNDGSFSELHHVGLDATHRQQPLGVVNAMGHSMGQPPMGVQTGFGEDQCGRGRNEYYSSSSKEGVIIPQQHPTLAAIPYLGNQQGRKMGAIGTQTLAPGHSGGSSMAPEFAMSKINDRAVIPSSTGGLPFRTAGPPGFINLSGTDAYRKHHEITAAGDNVPAPFTTFEATGFPREILREMRYLLVKSICRKLCCYTLQLHSICSVLEGCNHIVGALPVDEFGEGEPSSKLCKVSGLPSS